jgi:hypothetical protein
MDTLKTVARLSAVLAIGTALTMTAGTAQAKGDHHNNSESRSSESRKLMNTAEKSEHHKHHKDKDKYAEKKQKKECRVIISGTGTSPCGGTTKMGSGGTTTKPGGGGTPVNPPGYVTISNGVKTVTVPDVPGQFSAAWSNAGGIDVHVGNQTIFFPGPSVTVTGEAMSTSLAQRGGLQEVGISKAGVPVNEVTVSLAMAPSGPAPAPGPTPVPMPTKPAGNNGGGDGGVVGTLKDIGNGIEDIGLGFIDLGGPSPKPPQTGTITQQ